MLTLKQIIELYQDGVEIRFKKKPHHNGIKGEFDPASLEVIIYLAHINSKFDRDITILHEFVHAKNHHFGVTLEDEVLVEDEAIRTYAKKDYILEFIKRLYNLKD